VGWNRDRELAALVELDRAVEQLATQSADCRRSGQRIDPVVVHIVRVAQFRRLSTPGG